MEPILAGRGVGHLRVKGKQGRCKARLCVNESAAPAGTYLRRYPCGATWGCRLWGGEELVRLEDAEAFFL